MSLRSRYSLVVEGDYVAARVAPPVSGPRVYARLAREIADAHGLDPLSDPEELAAAEGIAVVWGSTPSRHGMHYRNTIIVSPLPDPRESSFVLTHERAHHFYWKLGAPHHSEADVMLLTIELAWPSWLRHRPASDVRHAPEWLAELVLRMSENRSQHR